MPDHAHDVLITAVLDLVAGNRLLTRQEIRASLEAEIDSAGPQALVDLKGAVHRPPAGRPAHSS